MIPSRLAAPLLAAALALQGFAAEPVTLDRIVAVVNKSVITEHELAIRIEAVKKNFARQKMATPADDALRRQVLDRLVTERVLLDYASDTGVRVDDRQLDQTIDRIADQNKLTPAQFRTALEKEGTSYGQFRDQIRQDLVIQRLREREVDNRVFVTDSEIDQFLAANKGADRAEQEYHLSHILIGLPEGPRPTW
ncbi:SurA N-terminal domain-containing protein [Chitinimonas koreensis]|uniref:SurA N-terminal domain-containing protein n=1 Tax=Chitinimonas koreensis TaxID=356302 RepID=UPI00223F8489|nr:SurA N-terminal domain-containing protein [Chitinimonas koreensis]